MIIKNVLVYSEEKKFIPGSIRIVNGKFAEATKPEKDEKVVDGLGAYAVPGLIDIHLHGCAGADMCDGSREALDMITQYEASVGVTSIVPATMTIKDENLHNVMQAAGAYNDSAGAKMVGINMEGPFINSAKKGAQDAKYIRLCDIDFFKALQKEALGKIKLVDIAPESEGAMDFIQAVKDEVIVSIAHTMADYDTALEAFGKGARHVTHLYNAMPEFSHREPGVVGAALDTEKCRVELICDNIHIHPAVVRAAFTMFGDDRIILISDSMRATGLSDGVHTLGGQEVTVAGKCACLTDGTPAGSVTNLMDCVRTAVTQMGISLESAIACATINPAKELNIYDSCGSIAPGKSGDLVLLDKDLNLLSVYIEGELITY